ncbi:MAG: 30S ribosomal protein S12 methylthiotransferase RimO [Ruminococcaceae bacterium]|nr:30S ribosomal protein S12 methylthiotransferase RimO [Oscillospiraceae bacterium]
MSKTIGMISLGCSKNQIDAEIMLAKLAENGFIISDDVDGADAVIINTCGFIEDAKKEAIENILDMAELKKEGIIGKIIVTGCMAERYREQIMSEIPEVDAVAGIGSNKDIVDICNRVIGGENFESYGDKILLPIEGERMLTTEPYFAYIKIAEGCSNNCTYCAIPQIRGPFRSRTEESILSEARQLASSGVKELIVIAQDTGRYGEDLYGSPKLAELLDKLCQIDSLEWVRVLYIYPERVTDELLACFEKNEKLLDYFDIPMQHADAEILKKMNRKGDTETLLELIRKIRSRLPDAVIRTTLITGFPGETEENFETLSDFVGRAEFDRLGCFAYSMEEGTPASRLPGQLDEEVKKHRCEVIMEQQFRVIEKINEKMIGKVLRTVVEGYDAYTDTYYGRTWRDAPEIDGVINFTCPFEINEGDFVDVEVMGVNEYDLIGEIV